MFNADVHFENFGERWIEPVLAPCESDLKRVNGTAFRALISDANDLGEIAFSLRDPKKDTQRRLEWSGEVFRVTNEAMLGFLEAYKWMQGKHLLQRPIEFLRGSGEEDPGVRKWLIIGPRRKQAEMGSWLPNDRFRLMRRSRVGDEETSSFKAFSERRHRLVAQYLARLGEDDAAATAANSLRDKGVGVAVVYHVVENPGDVKSGMVDDPDRIDSVVTIGLGLQFPGNCIRTSIRFGVKDPNQYDAVTVDLQT
jgi:hypothetical protein